MATYHNDGFYWSHSRFTYGSEEQLTNVRYITNYFRAAGWTDNAIAGILGNMQSESGINPGAYYGYKSFSSVSFGIVQWDPTSKYQTWHDERYPGVIYEHLGCQLSRIIYELENGIQYFKKTGYNYTFREFSKSTLPARTLGEAFVVNYERPASILNGTASQKAATLKTRGDQAEHWYSVITGIEGGGTVNPPSTTTYTTMYCNVVEGEYVNIRSGPGTSYAVIGKLHRGDTAQVESISDGWAKIGSPVNGYVMASYLQNSHPDTGAQAFTMYCIVNEGEYVNIRSGAGTTYSVIGKLHRGDPVTVESITGNWAKITAPVAGYVMLTYLQYTNPDSTSPGVEGVQQSSNDFIMKYLTLYKGRRRFVVR